MPEKNDGAPSYLEARGPRIPYREWIVAHDDRDEFDSKYTYVRVGSHKSQDYRDDPRRTAYWNAVGGYLYNNTHDPAGHGGHSGYNYEMNKFLDGSFDLDEIPATVQLCIREHVRRHTHDALWSPRREQDARTGTARAPTESLVYCYEDGLLVGARYPILEVDAAAFAFDSDMFNAYDRPHGWVIDAHVAGCSRLQCYHCHTRVRHLTGYQVVPFSNWRLSRDGLAVAMAATGASETPGRLLSEERVVASPERRLYFCDCTFHVERAVRSVIDPLCWGPVELPPLWRCTGHPRQA